MVGSSTTGEHIVLQLTYAAATELREALTRCYRNDESPTEHFSVAETVVIALDEELTPVRLQEAIDVHTAELETLIEKITPWGVARRQAAIDELQRHLDALKQG